MFLQKFGTFLDYYILFPIFADCKIGIDASYEHHYLPLPYFWTGSQPTAGTVVGYQPTA